MNKFAVSICGRIENNEGPLQLLKVSYTNWLVAIEATSQEMAEARAMIEFRKLYPDVLFETIVSVQFEDKDSDAST